MLNFGDLFYIEDKEYVYLFSDGESIYAAIVLNATRTKQVKHAEKNRDRKGASHQMLLYCYVELSTEEYRDCSANMITTQEEISLNTSPIRYSSNKLDKEDIYEIRGEILDSKDLFKPALVKHMEEIEPE